MTTLKLTLAALALTAAPAAFAQSSRPAMTAQDLVTLPRMGSVAVSPDGHLAVYALTTSNPQTINGRRRCGCCRWAAKTPVLSGSTGAVTPATRRFPPMAACGSCRTRDGH
jgi:hypothetical protein